MRVSRILLTVAAVGVCALVGASVVGPAAPAASTAAESVVGTYYPVEPDRLMDTRSGLGGQTGPLGAGQVATLQVGGRGGVPASGAGSVVLNVTVVGPTAASYLTLYPAGAARPTASSINYAAGWLGSNNVTVKLSTDGRVAIYQHAGATDVVVDVVGFYAADESVRAGLGRGGQLRRVEPTRLVDTRREGDPIPARKRINRWVDLGPDSPRVRALVLNVTAVAPENAGYLSAWAGDGPLPGSSTVNYAADAVVPNLAYVRAATCHDCGPWYGVPMFSVYTSTASHIVVDLVGVIDDGTLPGGLRFTPSNPTRIVDSRSGLGTSGALGANVTRRVVAPPAVVTDATAVLAMNVTAVAPTTATVITLWPADLGVARPGVSNLNPAAQQTVANAVLAVIGPQDAFHVHNAGGSTHVLADVVGAFTVPAGGTAAEPMRVLGTGGY
ncbi:hypothetical protein GA0070616_2497 [Micromonospora nigra]|uniref:Uncharacterized protein n=1 Tax=Micromonospora nigra TaxID=145857 RepID=A0A1C6RYD1_9ACTN|nr:hypothetical protein [Micromonospora nigra]SCL22229.1 hypothetical protein GA0070616_2497 [Micromonospora nigra]